MEEETFKKLQKEGKVEEVKEEKEEKPQEIRMPVEEPTLEDFITFLEMLRQIKMRTVKGTVAVTNGSANVVGTDTDWNKKIEGARFQVNGDSGWYIIQTVTDATHLTLNTNYNGTTTSGKVYITSPVHKPKSFLEQIDLFENGTNYGLFLYIKNIWCYCSLT